MGGWQNGGWDVFSFASNPPLNMLPKTIWVKGQNFNKSYTVFGDGVTDDSTTNQTAYNDAWAGGANAVRSLYLASAQQALATGLNWNGQVPVYGGGRGVTIFVAGAAIDMITLGTGNNNCSLNGFSLNGGGVANRGFNVTGSGAIQMNLSDVEVYACNGTPGTGFEAMGGNNAYSMTWQQVKLNGNKYGLRATGSVAGSPDHNTLLGLLCYYNSVGNIVLGDGVYVMNNWNFFGLDIEITGATAMTNMVVKGIQTLNLIGYYGECPGNAANLDIYITGALPSHVNLIGYTSGGGAVVASPIKIDANNSTLQIIGWQVNGMTGGASAIVNDTSTGTRATRSAGYYNGGVADGFLVGTNGVIQAGAGGFDFRGTGGGFLFNYNNGVLGAFQYYGGQAAPVFQSDYLGNVTNIGYHAVGKDLRRSSQTPTEAVLVSGVDATGGDNIYVTLTAARLVGAPINPAWGQLLTFILSQGGAGGFAVTWDAHFKKTWADTGNTTGKVATISFTYQGSSGNWFQDGAQAPYV